MEPCSTRARRVSISGSLNTSQSAHIFPVRAGAPPPSSSSTANLDVSVTDPGGDPVSGANVLACASTCVAANGGEGQDAGHYFFNGLQPGDYSISVAPLGDSLLRATKDVTLAAGDDLTTSIGVARASGTGAGAPPSQMTIHDCLVGILHYQIAVGNHTVASGTALDSGGGTYLIDFAGMSFGLQRVQISSQVVCAEGTDDQTTEIFADPSGTVVDDAAQQAALPDATVTLLDSSGNAVPAGCCRLSGATPQNPETERGRRLVGLGRGSGHLPRHGGQERLRVDGEHAADGHIRRRRLRHRAAPLLRRIAATALRRRPPPRRPRPRRRRRRPPPPPATAASAAAGAGPELRRAPFSGTVLVNGQPLVAGTQIPFGSTVDATKGTVTLRQHARPASCRRHRSRERSSGRPGGRRLDRARPLGGNFGVCTKQGATHRRKPRPRRPTRPSCAASGATARASSRRRAVTRRRRCAAPSGTRPTAATGRASPPRGSRHRARPRQAHHRHRHRAALLPRESPVGRLAAAVACELGAHQSAAPTAQTRHRLRSFGSW